MSSRRSFPTWMLKRRSPKPRGGHRAGRRLERYSADATALVQPRAPLPGGTWQGAGSPPAWNGASMALAGEAMAMCDDRMEREFGR